MEQAGAGWFACLVGRHIGADMGQDLVINLTAICHEEMSNVSEM